MANIFIIQDLTLLEQCKEKSIVFETNNFEKIEEIHHAVEKDNFLFCMKLHINKEITQIDWKASWQNIPLVVYPKCDVRRGGCGSLGVVSDLTGMLPIIKKLNVKFFLDSAHEQNYEAVQILSSLGIYSGILIHEKTDWEKLTDLMYYALCGRAPHAPIEPFQYAFDIFERGKLVDYGAIYFDDPEIFQNLTAKGAKETQKESWQQFFYEPTPCAACEGWRVCLGKYAALKNKTGCQTFATELLNVIENKKRTPLTPSNSLTP